MFVRQTFFVTAILTVCYLVMAKGNMTDIGTGERSTSQPMHKSRSSAEKERSSSLLNIRDYKQKREIDDEQPGKIQRLFFAADESIVDKSPPREDG